MFGFLFSGKVKENLRESGEVLEVLREGRIVRWEVVEESAAERNMFANGLSHLSLLQAQPLALWLYVSVDFLFVSDGDIVRQQHWLHVRLHPQNPMEARQVTTQHHKM